VVAVAPKGGCHDVNLQKFNINYFVFLFKIIHDLFEIIYFFYLRFGLLDCLVCQKILYCDYFLLKMLRGEFLKTTLVVNGAEIISRQ
jgi:hypothetical protein